MGSYSVALQAYQGCRKIATAIAYTTPC